MPDLCFYAPWIMKEPIPDPFRMMLEKAGKKRISYDEADCSMRNIRKQGKVSRLHGPTLHALLTLIQIRKEKRTFQWDFKDRRKKREASGNPGGQKHRRAVPGPFGLCQSGPG